VLWLDGKKPLDENRTGALGKENPPFAGCLLTAPCPREQEVWRVTYETVLGSEVTVPAVTALWLKVGK
jgi:hypothetical protein